MKAETIYFIPNIPDVKLDGLNYVVDFGNLILTLTPLEAASLYVGILLVGDVRKTVFDSLN